MTQKPHKIHQISHVLCSAAAGICQLIGIHALGNIIGIFELSTKVFDYVNPVIFEAAILVLMGLSYFLIKHVVDHKLPYFLGALLLESIILAVIIIDDHHSAFSHNPLYIITEYFTYAFMPILILDVILMIGYAVKKTADRKKADEPQTKAKKAKKNYYCLAVAFAVAVVLSISCKLMSGVKLMMLLPLPGIAYFYFQLQCKKQWLYTVVFVGASILTFIADLVLFSNTLFDDAGIMSISAVVTLLLMDISAHAVKKSLKK